LIRSGSLHARKRRLLILDAEKLASQINYLGGKGALSRAFEIAMTIENRTSYTPTWADDTNTACRHKKFAVARVKWGCFGCGLRGDI